MVKEYAFHLHQLKECPVNLTQDVRDQNCLLLFCLVNSINCQQEIAAPMVISYLMGWGDTYHSHHYILIYWSTFVNCLFMKFPELRPVQIYLIS